MITITSVPLCVTLLLRGMPGSWQSRHRLLLWWLVCMQALSPGRQPLAARARWTPAPGTVGRVRRLRKASDGHVHGLVAWGGQAARTTLPPPKDGPLLLVGDGREQPQRGTQHPLAHTGRNSAQHPWGCGMRFARVIVHGDGSRFPVALRLLRPQSHPASHTEHALCRELVGRFGPPSWATRVMVEGAAA